ncbi:transporter substrate-binding domain-containing protein [Paenibacillus sp. GCM10023248]|uniref:transporter substrate-binding domain-containing protein n=1 Tax=Bacillales TaxID=1385 RepID=UPI002377DC1A|nr:MULTISPECIES: transporter substrate-binding domain-containing protein [Bacillales]MDD9270441.1 transporter substrate-binding domain-containing protein [Paenibacillus sp. MAHUQ-63]MDR6884192.1 ABC-type amino acid transport substrate-binding protein [Bacillus sp. 3255]
MSVGNRAKRGMTLMIALLVMMTGSACGNNKTIKVGIEQNFRPFTYMEAGEKKGFEVELWQAIAKKADIKYELVPMEHGELIKSVKSGDVDLAIAGMTVSNARKNNFDYSSPYFQTGLVILTSKDNGVIKGKDDLAQKVVATKNGSTAYNYAGEIQGAKIRSYSNIADVYNELKNNTVDAAIFDERNATDFLKDKAQGQVKKVGEAFNKERYAVVAKKRNKYIGKVNKGIEAIGKDGTYEAVYTKWFGSKPEQMPDKIKKDLEYEIQHETVGRK